MCWLSKDTKTWRRWFCCLRPIPLYSRLSYVFPACCISRICGLKHWEVTKVLWVRRNNVISLHASKAQPLLIIEKTIWTKWIDLFIHSTPYVQREIQKSQKVTECWIMLDRSHFASRHRFSWHLRSHLLGLYLKRTQKVVLSWLSWWCASRNWHWRILKDEKPQQRTQFQTIPESSHALLTEPRGKIFADH